MPGGFSWLSEEYLPLGQSDYSRGSKVCLHFVNINNCLFTFCKHKQLFVYIPKCQFAQTVDTPQLLIRPTCRFSPTDEELWVTASYILTFPDSATLVPGQ
jgi:hypothetical protein